MRYLKLLALILGLSIGTLPLAAQDNLLGAWDGFWSRQEGQGACEVLAASAESQGPSLKISHAGQKDWSVANSIRVKVVAGEVYKYSIRAKALANTGDLQSSVVVRDANNAVSDWMYGLKTTGPNPEWQTLEGSLIIPPNCANIQFRLTGNGPGTWLVDHLSLMRTRAAPSQAQKMQPIKAVAAPLSINYDPQRRVLEVESGKSIARFDCGAWSASVVDCQLAAPDRLEFTLINPSGGNLKAIALATPVAAQFSLVGTGALDSNYAFPGPMLAAAGQSWVLPVNEGLLIPADDPAFQTWDLVLYGGHGLCMPFIGLTDGAAGFVAIAETPDDAIAKFTAPFLGASSRWSIVWQPSKGQWGYERKLRVLPVQGSHVAVAKAYRQYAAAKGLVVTLREKAKTVPQVDKLVGAVNLWRWKEAPWWTQDDEGAQAFGKELKKLGIDRVLWSHEQSAENVRALNDLGFLTGRYDIYQDVWGPENPHAWVNHDGWPGDLVLEANGTRRPGWVDRDQGKSYVGGVICSERSLVWEKQKVPRDLATHPYGARFIDTTTASPLYECYNPLHPATRSDDKRNKLEILAWLSREQKLVVGSETGFDFAVPAVHYFEGMMSLGPYRLPDSGYDLTSYKVPQPEFRLFQLGPKYRIPLFELVYHDCVVSYWYWGDSSNRVPELWDERDMFNALYGTGPLWIVDAKIWAQYRDRFVASYKNATTVARRTGYSEMTDHRFLSADHTLQTSAFADGTQVWVNFGPTPASLPDGSQLKPRSFLAKFPDGGSLAQ